MTRCINSPFTDIYFHLAAEEYLLKQCTKDFFMLWQDTASVVMGKHQRMLSEVNREWVEEQGIPIARRFSGGGTVYHDGGNINLTFIETVSRLPDFTLYLQRVIDFLVSLGLPAQADERLGIYLHGLKISGSAQCVYRNRVMYHCTLLFDTDLNMLTKAITPLREIGLPLSSAAGYAVSSVRSEVTNVRMYLPLSVSQFRDKIFRFFSCAEVSDDFNACELAAIERLRAEKYIQQTWICSR